MNLAAAILAVVVGLAAAVRSTWSPCGQSMLSQITPVAEASRGQKFGRTATWFILGALIGGATLGVLIAAGAAFFAAVDLGTTTTIALVIACSLAGAVIDSHILGFGPPFLRRQVNEDWLTRYRPWVYGGGFGWQIGFGLSTYVMTAAVGVTIALGALSASPVFGFALGVGFGLARGSAVLLGVPLRTRPALYAFHRLFDAWGEPVRQGVIWVQLLAAVIAAWIAAPIVVAVLVTAGAIALAVWTRVHSPRNTAPATGVAPTPMTQSMARG